MSIRVLLSEPTARNSAPVHVVVQHLRERVDVPARQCGVGLPYPTQIGVVHGSESSRNSETTACRAIAAHQPPMVWISCTPMRTGVVVRSSPRSPVAPFVACQETCHTIVTAP